MSAGDATISYRKAKNIQSVINRDDNHIFCISQMSTIEHGTIRATHVESTSMDPKQHG
jgi:hypothetical protein